jgi:hypothetical protein
MTWLSPDEREKWDQLQKPAGVHHGDPVAAVWSVEHGPREPACAVTYSLVNAVPKSERFCSLNLDMQARDADNIRAITKTAKLLPPPCFCIAPLPTPLGEL